MVLNVYLSYIILGLTLAAPIGPVNSARIDKGLKNGFWHAWAVGAGSMMADATFMLTVYLSLVRFLYYPYVQVFLWLFGGFVLIYSGIESMVSASSLKLEQRRAKESIFKCFFSGFIISISSPMSILFWLGIYGSVLAKTASSYGPEKLLIYSSMIFLGLCLWDIFVAALASGSRRFLNANTLVAISVISGLSLVGFGVYFGVQGIKALANL
ncbi:amino acid transporter [Bacillus sp. FJAT-18017]|uniref:LysE family transporter n=1 Tax=Bacillus sp. FJAT-18017 TaxID=1705566 RepID=UPI0006B03F15|nr:LysE family transporter [Bacillus sp. FJAT-18017]ALC92320.1 amino acid transporter [Bacillus sp. FJAT-18017]